LEEKNKIDKVIGEILDIEWTMFSSVKASEKNTCQEDEKTFRLMRWMSYSVFDETLLQSILLNLKTAKEFGRNLMTEKYARMEEKISPLSTNPLIQKIASVEVNCMKEVAEKYPTTFGSNKEGFGKYTKCELETYSDLTLQLYYNALLEYEKDGINIVEERYNNLFRKLGYDSVADKESQEKAKVFWQNNTCRGC